MEKVAAAVVKKSHAGLIIGIIAGVVVIGGSIGAFFYFKNKKAASAGDGKKPDDSKGDTTNPPADSSDNSKPSDSGSGGGGSSSGGGSGTGGGLSTPKQSPNLVNTTDPTLPNKGKGCGQIKTTHDGDYDYVLCSGTWYTRSKANPKTKSVKGSIPNWKSLGANIKATQNLNVAYPQG